MRSWRKSRLRLLLSMGVALLLLIWGFNLWLGGSPQPRQFVISLQRFLATADWKRAGSFASPEALARGSLRLDKLGRFASVLLQDTNALVVTWIEAKDAASEKLKLGGTRVIFKFNVADGSRTQEIRVMAIRVSDGTWKTDMTDLLLRLNRLLRPNAESAFKRVLKALDLVGEDSIGMERRVLERAKIGLFLDGRIPVSEIYTSVY